MNAKRQTTKKKDTVMNSDWIIRVEIESTHGISRAGDMTVILSPNLVNNHLTNLTKNSYDVPITKIIHVYRNFFGR